MSITKRTIMGVALSLALFGIGCDVDKTEEGRAPDVDFDPGRAPRYDVETAEVEVGTETEQVRVPDVDIEMPDEHEAKE